MPADIRMRFARADDATAIVSITRSSIAELCVADHRGDPVVLEQWLANKTTENILRWLANPQNRNVIAELEGAPIGYGCMTVAGHILLNYVAASARFRGASNAMLACMESIAREAGVVACTLESTGTAHRFYLRRGYIDVPGQSAKFGIPCFPMRKTLQPEGGVGINDRAVL